MSIKTRFYYISQVKICVFVNMIQLGAISIPVIYSVLGAINVYGVCCRGRPIKICIKECFKSPYNDHLLLTTKIWTWKRWVVNQRLVRPIHTSWNRKFGVWSNIYEKESDVVIAGCGIGGPFNSCRIGLSHIMVYFPIDSHCKFCT